MELEVDNVRAVLRRCADHEDSRPGLALATSLIWYWITRATAEGVRWLDELLPSEAEPFAPPWAYFARASSPCCKTIQRPRGPRLTAR